LNAAEAVELHQVVIGIGSNIRPQWNIPKAITAISKLTQVIAVSNVYKTTPVGGNGPDFLNAAIDIRTHLSQSELRSEVTHKIEASLGRKRSSDPNAPRTIDLDVLIYDGTIIDQNLTVLPHLCIPVADLLPIFKDSTYDKYIRMCAEKLVHTANILAVSLDLDWRGTS
jgi:2-amino-4-hydroxy-6-hydroxymethyldihydropteridine diphosphokinase